MDRINRAVSVKVASFAKNRDEHRRNILQEIFRLRFRSKVGGVLTQFVCHLVDYEGTAGGEGVGGLSQEIAFFLDLQNAERNAGNDVIAICNTASRQL